MPVFRRYIGIDYSGAKTPTESLKGLRVYMATGGDATAEVPPPPSPRKYWTRRGLSQWLAATVRETEPTIVGIDHAFSFPQAYFDRYNLPHNWHTFLDDFCAHWPTDDDHIFHAVKLRHGRRQHHRHCQRCGTDMTVCHCRFRSWFCRSYAMR